MKSNTYRTLGTVQKYHCRNSSKILLSEQFKNITVGTVPKYRTVGTVPKYHTVGTVPKYHTVETVPKINRKIVERGKIDTPNTQIHDLSP